MVGRRTRRRRDRSDPGHESFRNFARVAGPILCVVGASLFIAGMVSFGSSFSRDRAEFDKRWNESQDRFDKSWNNFPGTTPRKSTVLKRSRPKKSSPNRFWLCFVGMPLLIAGAWLTKAGYFGAAARYVAAESRPAIHTVTQAVVAGLRDNDDDDDSKARTKDASEAACPGCGDENDGDAKFCKSCGHALATKCPKCGEAADADAKFCDECGTPLG